MQDWQNISFFTPGKELNCTNIAPFSKHSMLWFEKHFFVFHQRL
jgi:hypothetical protein